MPARHVSRGALGAVVFAGASAVAMLSLPMAGESVGLAVPMPRAPSGAATRAADPVTEFLTAAAVSSAVSEQSVSEQSVSDRSRPEASDSEPSDSAPPDSGRRPASGPTVPEPTVAEPTPSADPDAPAPADLDAGILRRDVPESGSGAFDVAPGSERAPGVGVVHTLRVEVEHDLPVDPLRFADFVLTTLNDPRGWGHGGTMTFARTDGDAPVTVLLASPATSARLCDDDGSDGALSCRNGPQVVLNFSRWVDGTAEYAADLPGYRQYLVNHEVGHWLGHGHERCPGPGLPAPVMQQQTLGLKGCAPNSWPYPDTPAAG